MGRTTLDPESPPVLSDAELAALDALTPGEIARNARDDPDNPPMTADELSRLRLLHPPRPARARRRSGGAS